MKSFSVTDVLLARLNSTPSREYIFSDKLFTPENSAKRIIIIEDNPYIKNPMTHVSFDCKTFTALPKNARPYRTNIFAEIINESKIAKPWEKDDLQGFLSAPEKITRTVSQDLWIYADELGEKESIYITKDLSNALAVKVSKYSLDEFNNKDIIKQLKLEKPYASGYAIHLPLSDEFLERIYQKSLAYANDYHTPSQFLYNLSYHFKSIELPKLNLFWQTALQFLKTTPQCEDYLEAAQFARVNLADTKLEKELLAELFSRIENRSIFETNGVMPEICTEVFTSRTVAHYYRRQEFTEENFQHFSEFCDKTIAICKLDPVTTMDEFFEFIEIFIHHNVYSTDWSSVNLNKYLDGLIRNFLDNLQDKKVKAKLSKKLKPVFESISKNVNQYGEPHLPI